MRVDLANKMKYEQVCYDSGIHCSAWKAIVESMGYDLLSYTPRLTDEADYIGVDGYFSFINPKTHKSVTLSVDFKFRSKDYGDVLYNWRHRNGGPGWACNPKKINDVVVNVVVFDTLYLSDKTNGALDSIEMKYQSSSMVFPQLSIAVHFLERV